MYRSAFFLMTLMLLSFLAIPDVIACSGNAGRLPPPSIAAERSAVTQPREGLYRWPSMKVTSEDVLRGPIRSTERTLVILYKFKDTANPLGTSTTANWVDRVFGDSVSVADYWNDVSYGSLTLRKAAETGGTSNDGLVGWYTSANNFSHYLDDDEKVLRGSIIYDAITASDADVNYANFDDDSDGFISCSELHIVVIVAAYEASYDNSPSPWIWRVNWEMANQQGNYPTLDGKKICVAGHGSAAIIGERYYKGTNVASVVSEFGIVAHEVGHQLGLPDLYDTDDSSYCYGGKGQGLGYWDLMASGDWLHANGTESGHTPAHPSSWCKAYRGWLIPTEVTEDADSVSIYRYEDNAVCYKLWTSGQYGGDNKQYFLVENREKTGYDKALPGCGLMIYHVDETVTDYEETATHEFIDVETADGFTRNADGTVCNNGCANCTRDHLDVYTWHDSTCVNTPDFDNRGDSTDPWYSGNKATFNKDSCPSSKDYAPADTKVAVLNIGACANPMSADLHVGAANQNTPDVWIHDCAQDNGAEPDQNCANNFWESNDVWIDNDRDGTQDAPAMGKENRFFIGVRNRGAGPAVNVTVKLYHRNNSTGLTFPTGATLDGTMVIGLVPVGGAVRTELLTTIPNSPGDGHWCFGVTLDTPNDTLDTDAGLEASNNKACVNYPVLCERRGNAIPADFAAENPDDDSSPGGGMFNVQVHSNLPAGWQVHFIPGAQLPVYLEKGQTVPMRIEVYPPAGDQHGYAGTVEVVEYRVTPPVGVTGGITFPIYQDNRPPQVVTDLTATAVVDSIPGGEGETPLSVRLSWTPVVHDVNGTAEMIDFYEVHRALTDNFTPDPMTLIASASADGDPDRPGFQYVDRDPHLNLHVRYFYRVIPIDHAQWRGAPSNTAGALGEPLRELANLDVGNVKTTVTERGAVGFLDATQMQGSGFVFPKTGSNQLYIGSLWVGRSATAVDNRDYDADPLKEWRVAAHPDGHLVEFKGPADQGFACGFVDSAAVGASLGLYVRQESYAWSESGTARYVILRYQIENQSTSTISSLYAGLFCDWDIGLQYLQNTGRVEADRGLVYMASPTENLYCGIRLLSGPLTPPRANLTLIDNATYVWPNQYVLDTDKFAFLSAADAAHIMTASPQGGDYGALASAGPFTLAAGQMREFVVALVAGSSLDEVRQAADRAASRYPFEPSAVGDGKAARLVTRLSYCQPNPFSAGTAIGFTLAAPAVVRLEIYDVGGRRVRTLLSGTMAAGDHQLAWDCRDEAGRRAGSGVYFVKLAAGVTREARAIVLTR